MEIIDLQSQDIHKNLYKNRGKNAFKQSLLLCNTEVIL